MILQGKKLFFKTIFIIFEDDKIISSFTNKKNSSIVGITRTDLHLPGVSRRVKSTAVIDLLKNKEDIFAEFSDTTRNEINRTYSLSDLKIITEDTNHNGIYGLYKSFEYSQNRIPFPISNLKQCLIFSAYYKDEIISAIYLDIGGKDLRIRYIFSKRLNNVEKEIYKIIGYATKRLIWEICLWGKKNGYISLDMATVNFENKQLEGITKFKMSFGGKVVPEYTYIYRSSFFRLFEKLAIFKNRIKMTFHI